MMKFVLAFISFLSAIAQTDIVQSVINFFCKS